VILKYKYKVERRGEVWRAIVNRKWGSKCFLVNMDAASRNGIVIVDMDAASNTPECNTWNLFD
jgi:hypothetical protein